MSSASVASPSSSVQHRDIRSASKPYKRDKDHSSKWINGTRPSPGVRENLYLYVRPEDESDLFIGGSASQRAKVRPERQYSQGYKTHANKTPKPTANKTWQNGCASGRVIRKIEAQVEATVNSDISRSLMELIPHHVSNDSPGVQTVIYVPDDDEAIAFSENSQATPTKKGRATGLGGLIEKAEEKFLDEQTERMVKDDYEVLDVEGESIVLKGEKKRKGSPKQKAAKAGTQVVEDDGFELI